ncbi:ornithine decarboxylase [Armillaria novae-zelandiae]|uniref:ornithine decarboxylase n=1 Tax=Armillaria novae-zelandiae TaxID=153914 RepID=A0AA39PEE9_9AGAR|nr:ornithine decarboxylase [Armillaria novae-zelandiae]
MSQVEILRPINPVDYDLSRSISYSSASSRWVATNALVNDILSSSPLHLTTEGATLDDHLFPDLPPLRHGHPEIHLRNGVINASQLAAQNVPDAEKAFFVGDLSQVYRQHQRWRACLPEVQPFYAIKCNPDPYVLRLLAALGTGFDCASNGEINQVLAIGGIDPSRIVFANPCKAVSFVRNAGKVGVDMMTFDNADELYKVSRAHPRAKLIIRILADDSKSICAFGVKFGAPLANVPGLLAKAKELNLNVVGVSFHVGSGCYDPSAYTDAIMRSHAVFDMGKEAGYTFNLLDVGGGFEDVLFEQAAQYLTEAIDQYFPDRRDLKIIAEPGRFYVSRAFSLATNVIARRAPFPVDGGAAAVGGDSSQQPSVMYYINDGVYGAFNCIMFDHQTVNPYVLSMGGSFHVPPNGPQSMSSVWGPTCDSIDLICASTRLPDALQVGDWLAFDNMGAYTICAASQFNGFETSHVVYTTGGPGGMEVRRALAAFAMSLE